MIGGAACVALWLLGGQQAAMEIRSWEEDSGGGSLAFGWWLAGAGAVLVAVVGSYASLRRHPDRSAAPEPALHPGAARSSRWRQPSEPWPAWSPGRSSRSRCFPQCRSALRWSSSAAWASCSEDLPGARSVSDSRRCSISRAAVMSGPAGSFRHESGRRAILRRCPTPPPTAGSGPPAGAR